MEGVKFYEVKILTLLQEARERINSLPEEKIKQVIVFIDLLENSSNAANTSISKSLPKSERINRFLSTAGKFQIDAASIYASREGSMI